jgi:hypothetical protein
MLVDWDEFGKTSPANDYVTEYIRRIPLGTPLSSRLFETDTLVDTTAHVDAIEKKKRGEGEEEKSFRGKPMKKAQTTGKQYYCDPLYIPNRIICS